MGGADFTDRERHLMSLAWQCFEEPPKVDYEKLANLAGMSNPRSASNAWAMIKKKMMQATSDAPATPASNKSSPKKRGKSAKGDQDDDLETSPSKKPKTPKGKATKSTKKELGEDDDSGSVSVKKEAVEDLLL